MKKLILILLLATQSFAAEGVYLPNLKKFGTGTTTGAKSGLDVYISGGTPSAPVNVTGSGSAAAATVSTVITSSAPANAVGFILMNVATSTTNLRWSVGRTATATLGQQLQPGRDTGFVPLGANVSLCAESGTVTYDIQWVSQ